MGINIGGSTPERIQVGEQNVANVYRGADLIWVGAPAEEPVEPSPEIGGGLIPVLPTGTGYATHNAGIVNSDGFPNSRAPSYGHTAPSYSTGSLVGCYANVTGGDHPVSIEIVQTGQSTTIPEALQTQLSIGGNTVGEASDIGGGFTASSFGNAHGYFWTAQGSGVQVATITHQSGTESSYIYYVGSTAGSHTTPITINWEGGISPFGFGQYTPADPTELVMGPVPTDTTADVVVYNAGFGDTNAVSITNVSAGVDISSLSLGVTNDFLGNLVLRGVPSELGSSEVTVTVSQQSSADLPVIDNFAMSFNSVPSGSGNWWDVDRTFTASIDVSSPGTSNVTSWGIITASRGEDGLTTIQAATSTMFLGVEAVAYTDPTLETVPGTLTFTETLSAGSGVFNQFSGTFPNNIWAKAFVINSFGEIHSSIIEVVGS